MFVIATENNGKNVKFLKLFGSTEDFSCFYGNIVKAWKFGKNIWNNQIIKNRDWYWISYDHIHQNSITNLKDTMIKIGMVNLNIQHTYGNYKYDNNLDSIN